MAAPESRCGLEIQQTSVQKQTHLLCPFSFQFSLETIYCSEGRHTATGTHMPHWDHTVLPATRQRRHSRPYPQPKLVLD